MSSVLGINTAPCEDVSGVLGIHILTFERMCRALWALILHPVMMYQVCWAFILNLERMCRALWALILHPVRMYQACWAFILTFERMC